MHDLIHSNIFAQLVGFVAFGFTIALFQAKKRPRMLLMQVCGAFLYTIHFLLLGAFTGAIMSFTGAFRGFVYLKLGKKRPLYVPILFIVIFLFATLLTWQGLKSLLPFAGMTLGTLAYWQSKPSKIRILLLMASTPWLVYGIVSRSYPGVITELFAMSSNLIGMYRFDIGRSVKRVR